MEQPIDLSKLTLAELQQLLRRRIWAVRVIKWRLYLSAGMTIAGLAICITSLLKSSISL